MEGKGSAPNDNGTRQEGKGFIERDSLVDMD